MLVISLAQKEGIASTRPGIICQKFGTILLCLCNSPYPPSYFIAIYQSEMYIHDIFFSEYMWLDIIEKIANWHTVRTFLFILYLILLLSYLIILFGYIRD